MNILNVLRGILLKRDCSLRASREKRGGTFAVYPQFETLTDLIDEFAEPTPDEPLEKENPFGLGPRFRYFEHIDGRILEVDTEGGEVIYNTPDGDMAVTQGLSGVEDLLKRDLIREAPREEVDEKIEDLIGFPDEEGLKCSCSPEGMPHSHDCKGWFPGDPCYEDVRKYGNLPPDDAPGA